MPWMWIGFVLLVLLLLTLDLAVFHRKAHTVGVKEALLMSGVWIGLALAFNGFIYFAYENRWLVLARRGTLPTAARRRRCSSPAMCWKNP